MSSKKLLVKIFLPGEVPITSADLDKVLDSIHKVTDIAMTPSPADVCELVLCISFIIKTQHKVEKQTRNSLMIQEKY